MKLLGRKKDDDAAGNTGTRGVEATGEAATAPSRGARATTPKGTEPKGRPTPRRDESSGHHGKRGPVAPAPMTAAEARARRKATAGPKPSRAERRAQKAQRREVMADRRERMMAGDESHLLARDRGPVRRLVRDTVDARRNLLGLFMPSALTLLFFGMALPQIQLYIYPAMLGLMALMAVDAVILARKAVSLADAKYPDNVERRWKLALYATGRASQLRKMRIPRPQVNRGDRVDRS